MSSILIAAASLTIVLGLAGTWVARSSRRPKLAVRALVGGLLSANGLALLFSLALALLTLASPAPVLAQEPTTPAAGGASQVAIGAALATGLACIGAGIAVGIAGAAAIGGITEKPEILGRALIFVGLAEGIAIYGLIISFIILTG